MRTSMRSLGNSAVDDVFGVKGANYVIRVDSDNPAKAAFTSFSSEIPGILASGAANALGPGEDFTSVYHFIDVDWNTLGAADLALDGVQSLIQNGTTGGVMSKLQDFVFINSATLTIPGSSDLGEGWTGSGRLKASVDGLSFNRPEGLSISGELSISKSKGSSYIGVGALMSKDWSFITNDWSPLLMKFGVLWAY